MSKIVLTDSTTPVTGIAPSTTALYTKSGGGPGTDGLYYKQGADSEVGPIIAGGTVNNLQDAYDGGASIAVTTVDGPVSVSSLESAGTTSALEVNVGASTNAFGLYLLQEGNSNGIYVLSDSTSNAAIRSEVTDVTATAEGLKVVQAGTGPGVYVEATEATAFSAVVSGIGLNAKGLTVDLTAPGSQGNGIGVDIASTGVGIGVQQAGKGNGVYVTSASTSNAAIQAVASASGTADAFKAQVTDPTSTGSGLRVNHSGAGKGVEILHNGSGKGLAVSTSTGDSVEVVNLGTANCVSVLLQSGSPGYAVKVRNTASPTPVFTVDSAGNTTTPSVVFNALATVTVRGDTGLPGTPINPRIELTSGSISAGVVARTHFLSININGTVDLEANPTITSQQPTIIYGVPSGPGSVKLPASSRYPEGTEILFLNKGSGAPGPITVLPIAPGPQNLVKVDESNDSLLIIPVSTGARFLSRGANGWTKTGTF